MKENLFDLIERMESIIPDYGYQSVSKISETDKKIKMHLISQIKLVKDDMFHVVQSSYELQRDRLSEASENVWDDVTSLMNRIENSKTCNPKGGKQHCEECMKRVERNLHSILRKDRELILMLKDMKKDTRVLYRTLFDKGEEKSFIKNLDKIKTYVNEINELIEEREKSIVG
jgi:uncharacterized hydantoinase/oxoprolinase family protein